MNQKRCRSCQHMDVNEMSDEMYCKLKDYEPIRLGWHKNRPDWCPLVMCRKEKKDKLKPCPFCGGPDIYETFTEEYSENKNPIIFCNSCKVIFCIEVNSPYLRFDEDYKYRREQTVKAWNRRAK